jgi:hypothetical protein
LTSLLFASPANAGLFQWIKDYERESSVVATDCAEVLTPVSELKRLGEGSIERLFRRTRVTTADFEKGGKILSRTEQAVLYEMPNGMRFVVKPLRTRKERAAFLVDQRLKLGIVPQVEIFNIDGKPYSVMKFVSDRKRGMPPRRVIDAKGVEREITELAPYVSNPLPDEIVLFDALIGNTDRSKGGFANGATEANYLVLSPSDELIDLRKGPYRLPEARFVAIDHGLAFHYFDLDRWAMMYRIDLPGFKLDRLREMLRRNPGFVKRLREWNPKEIEKDLALDLDYSDLRYLLQRREALLKLAR